MQRGDVVFSPISHSHPIEKESGVIGNHTFWAKQDDEFQMGADRVCVLKIDGWEDSLGVRRELEIAARNSTVVEYLGAEWGEPIISEPAQKTAYQLAEQVTRGDRNNDYGDAYENAACLAHIMTGILWRKLKAALTPAEAFLCMAGGKLCRESFKHKQDNLTDTIGYAKLIDEDSRFHQ